MKFMQKMLATAVTASALFGCTTVGPNYEEKIPVELPEAWNHRLGFASVDQTSYATWWQSFDDPILTDLILNAQKSNLDLKTAYSRVRNYEIQLEISETLNKPTLDAVSSGSVSRTSDASEAVTGFPADTDAFATVGAIGSWEIDLFGRIERQIESALANSEAANESYRDILVTLNAQVASVYIDLRGIQQSLEIQKQLVINREKSLKIAQTLYKTNLGSELEVERANRLLLASQSDIHQLTANYHKNRNRLSYLLGLKPGQLPVDLSKDKMLPSVPSNVVVSIPRDIVRQRPDIRMAERQLAAQTAQIGIASADLYPRLSLNGLFGFADTDASLVSDSALFWTFGPRFTWNIFDSGRRIKRIELEESKAEQARIAYEKTILSALAEVENNLSSIQEETKRLEISSSSLSSADKSLQLATTTFESGLASYQIVLDAELQRLTEQSKLISTKTNTLKHYVALYRSMGGGWSDCSGAVLTTNKSTMNSNEEV